FLLGFMLLRDGGRGTVRLFSAMGLPGLGVALCFATASTSFIVALSHTTVANILLMQAGVPLIAALFAWALFGERVSAATWGAIAAVIAGVAIMVSDSLTGAVSPVGDGLALLIAFAFAGATLITRRYAHVRMTPAVCTGTVISAAFAATQAAGLSASATDFGLFFVFGALNLGLGMALFVTGARMIPSALAALIGTLETVLGPVWVWLVHGETPSQRTVIGGTVILVALLFHIARQWRLQAKQT
ncbi:MAG TPA: DMT family transporter, partial [Rhizobiaceae bacterium]|nr:DMT family transporter [Rhizobiaceae bacterium]